MVESSFSFLKRRAGFYTTPAAGIRKCYFFFAAFFFAFFLALAMMHLQLRVSPRASIYTQM